MIELLIAVVPQVRMAPPVSPGQLNERVAEVLESCGACHGKERLEFEGGVHGRAGIDCITCHGGVAGPTDAVEAHGDDLVVLSDRREGVEACGGCHSDLQRMRLHGLRTDQLVLYWTSQHGARLAQDEEAKVATCVSCHGSHQVLSHTDSRSPVHPLKQVETCGSCHSDPELMEPYGLDTDVAENYRGSVHGRALLVDEHVSAPVCSDCHGSHGAQPPGVEEVEMVCGHCHSVVQSYYEQSAHFAGAISKGSVQCASCHDNHGIVRPTAEMFLGDDEGHCGACHEGDRGAEAAAELFSEVQRFDGTIVETERAIGQAATRGLFLGEEQGYLDESRALLVRARALTHAVSPEKLVDALSRGDAMIERTLESLAIKQRGSRDVKILTGIFFGISIALSIVLLMYARMIRGRWKAPSRNGLLASGPEVRDGS